MRFRNLAGAAALALSMGCGAWSQQQCSLASVVGKWAHNVLGWDIPQGATTPVQIAFLGVLSVDWSGKVTGVGSNIFATQLAGVIPPGTELEYEYVNGSIQITPDCTGLLTTYIQFKGLPIPAQGPYTGRILVFPDKGEMVAMAVRGPGDKPIWTYTLRRMSTVPGPVEWPAVSR